MTSTIVPAASGSTSVDAGASTEGGGHRPRRRWAYAGPRCPQCGGPLVFGEGCSLCPVCGHSSCAV